MPTVSLKRQHLIALFLCTGFFIFPVLTHAASLRISPAAGTFEVGSTVDVSLYLDTENQPVNAIEVGLSFPADKLQVVNPSTGQSIVSIWTSQPKFNNETGKIEFSGGIPNGINVKSGLITTITFRIRSTGPSVVKLLDSSRVLANDGHGTDLLGQTQNGVFQLVLPPPAGPVVASETHPVQDRWYRNANPVFSWAVDDGADGYSYVLNDQPIDIPDDISEGSKNNIFYKGIADGTKYFHIKALRNGAWGGTTHFAVNIDTTAPADFTIEVVPGVRTNQHQPVTRFTTTDADSGLDHYEAKLVSFQAENEFDRAFFIEVQSPYVTPKLPLGSFDFIVRAYDRAGNYREVTQRIRVVESIFTIVQDKGLQIGSFLLIPWPWFWSIAIVLLLLIIFVIWKLKSWHDRTAQALENKKVASEHVTKQLQELQRYQKKYGKLAVLVLLFASLLLGSRSASAQQVEFPPPVVTSASRDIFNDEIFYVGGKTAYPSGEVTIYLESLQSGETTSYIVSADKNGDWFYRHSNFLSSGNYLLWAQAKVGMQSSPPSPQVQMSVHPAAIQLGASRISYEVIYLTLVILLLILLIIVCAFVVFYWRKGKARRRQFLEEIRRAEESVRRGFALVKRDIEAEFAVIKKARLSRELSAEEKARERQIERDLQAVENHIGEEVWELERIERR